MVVTTSWTSIGAQVAKQPRLCGDMDRSTCQPRGSNVVTAPERGFSLNQGTLDHERTVQADYQTMSALTTLFVRDCAVKSGLPPRSLLSAMGPFCTDSCVSHLAAL